MEDTKVVSTEAVERTHEDMLIEKVSLSAIKIGVRRRVEMGDIDKLRSSIERKGLLNAIIITEDYELVAGFRRLTCCRELGFKDIYARFKKDLNPLEIKELELEENVHEALTWDEIALLRDDIHKLKQEIYGKPVKGHESDGWTLDDTADSLGVSAGTMSQDLQVAQALRDFPNLRKFGSKRQALKTLSKARETAILTELARREPVATDFITGQPYILHNGAAQPYLIENVADEIIDLVFFDPPWGVDIDVIGNSRGLGGDKTSYHDDSLSGAKKMTENLLPEIYRVMKENTHMYMFVGTLFANYWISYLSNMKLTMEPGEEPVWSVLQPDREWSFDVREIPILWVKEGGGYTDFEVRFMPRYETILHCNKGLRRLNYACSDVIECNRPLSVERIHTQQKPIELYQQFMRLSSLPNELILDPCAGSFASIRAATLLGRRSIGIEKEKEIFDRGTEFVKGTVFGQDTIVDEEEEK